MAEVTMNGWQAAAVSLVLAEYVGSGDHVDAVTIGLDGVSIFVEVVSAAGLSTAWVGPTGERLAKAK